MLPHSLIVLRIVTLFYILFIAEQSLIDVAKKMSVAEYLKYLKLPQYIELFKEEEVDGKMLWEMCHASDDELADLGVTNAFHRRKIKGKLEEYLSKLDE